MSTQRKPLFQTVPEFLPQTRNWQNPYQVLIVEDDADIRDYIEECLRLSSVNIITCNDGSEGGLILNRKKNIDIVLSDLNMPGVNGFEMVNHYNKQKADNAGYRRPVFLMLTGNCDKSAVIKAAELGIEGYILKPFSEEQIQKAVEQALKANIYNS